MTRARRLLLAVVILFLGGSGLVYEYCLSTLATHLLGNSIEQFSLIIGLMLFAMGIAGYAQKSLTDTARLPEIFVLIEVALGVVGGASALLLYVAFGWLEHFELVLYGLALLIGFGIGLEIPLLLRINQAHRDALQDNVADVFSLDYVGALLGALVWAFVLLPAFPLDRISLLLGLLNMGAAAVTLLIFWGRIQNKIRVISAIIVATAVLGLLAFKGPDIVTDARQHLYASPIRHHVKSPFQDIVVTGQGPRFRLYLNGRLQFDSEDEYIYHELLTHPAMLAAGSVKRVLVLGGGDGLAVREVLRWPGVESVLLVDLDPEVTRLARTLPEWVALSDGALLDPRVEARPAEGISAGDPRPVEKAAERGRLGLRDHVERVATVQTLHLDADRFLRVARGPFDVILADFPDPSSPDLAKLFSLELYQQARRVLRAGGVMAVQAGSPYTNRRAFWAVRDTLEAAGFGVTSLHAHVPSFGEWGWHVARNGPAPVFAEGPPVPTRYLDAAVLHAATVFPAPMARPDQTAVSTRLDPRVLQLYLAGEPLDRPALFPGSADR